VPAEQVADTIFTSVTLNSLSPLDDEALGVDEDAADDDDEDELPELHEPDTST
jgi:hypothetical protein